MSTGSISVKRPPTQPIAWAGAQAFRPLHLLMAWPSLLFLATLTLMLFRPPDLDFYGIDRIAFVLLLSVAGLRALVMRQALPVTGPVTWPLFGLLALAFADLLNQPFIAENWSVFAAKLVVPFAFYHVAQQVFDDEERSRQIETFCLVVLAYLCLMAVFFLMDAKSLIFPAYILDENLGIHADRARGPFLQAVANGVSLVLLGLIALNAYRRGRLRGVLAFAFLAALPLAVLATKTRSVWASFAAAALWLSLTATNSRVRRACISLVVAGAIATVAVFFLAERDMSLSGRLEERSPVEFRFSVYRAGWEMFQEKPIWGWPGASIQQELHKRVEDFHQQEFYFHNSFLEVAVNHGLVGLALYLWVLFDLLCLSRFPAGSMNLPENTLIDRQFRSLWPVFVGVYAFNACFVVMNYQFVNGLLFALAGMLAADNRRVEMRAR